MDHLDNGVAPVDYLEPIAALKRLFERADAAFPKRRRDSRHDAVAGAVSAAFGFGELGGRVSLRFLGRIKLRSQVFQTLQGLVVIGRHPPRVSTEHVKTNSRDFPYQGSFERESDNGAW
jgi:hypothetical protein